MDFAMPADLTAYLDELDTFIEAEIRPLELADDNIRFFDHRREHARTDWDNQGLPREAWEQLLKQATRLADAAGHWRFSAPKKYGGKDGSNLWMAVIREHFAAKGLGLHNDLQNEHSIVGNFPFVEMFEQFGTSEAQKQEFILGGFEGRRRTAFGLTEPDHGSDATHMETRGVRETRDGVDGWRIDGRKMWITGMHVATHCATFCRTSGDDGDAKGITCLLVPTGTPGMTVDEYMWTFNMPTDHPRIAGRGGVLHRGERQICAGAQAVRRGAGEEPGDPVPARRAGDAGRNAAPAHPQDRMGHGQHPAQGNRTHPLRQGQHVQLLGEPPRLRSRRPRDAGPWRHRILAPQTVRTYLPPPPPIPHHRRRRRNTNAKGRRISVRISRAAKGNVGVRKTVSPAFAGATVD